MEIFNFNLKKVSESIWAVITNYHRWGGLHTMENLFLTVLGAGNSSSGSQHGQVSCSLWVTYFALFPHLAEGIRDYSAVFFIRVILFMRAPHLWPQHLPKAPPSNSITLSIKISIYEFWEDTHIQTIPGMPTRWCWWRFRC